MFNRMVSAALALVFIASMLPAAASAQGIATGSISGTVLDQTSGLAVAGATVRANGGGTEKTTTTTASGAFAFSNLQPGLYQVIVSGNGYQPQRVGDVALLNGSTSYVNFLLTRARTSQDLSTIATVSAHAGGNALTSTTTISKSLDPSLLKAEGYTRFVDAVRTLPGVNFSGNLTAAAGDDASIDIRGLGPTESVALLDGHPTGPQGVYPINGGGAFATSFNYSDSPFALLKNVQVTYGSGAAGLYGVDAIGGTIDMQTLAPTRDYHSSFSQSIGNQGMLASAVTSTGTLGKLGYAFGGTVSGLYGLYAPGTQVAQTAYPVGVPQFSTCPAQPNFDLTTCTLKYNTYQVTGNTTLRGGLAKLVYAMSNNTSLSGTWYAAGQWADSTGNGDADYLPTDTRLAFVPPSGGNCALPTDTGGATSGYAVSSDSNPNACYTSQQFAAATSGPNGGGPGRNRGTGMFDYHLRFATTDRKSTYTADYFFDHYKFFKDNTQSGGLAVDPSTGVYPGTLYSQWDNTQGILISDDIVNEKSEFAFGYLSEHQLQTRQNYSDAVYKWIPPQTYGYASVFARGNVQLSSRFTVFGNLWATRSTVTQQSNLDPRISLVYRPIGGRDVVRFTYGHATGDPAAELRSSGAPQVTGNPASLNAVCSPYNVVGQGGNPLIKAEGATDFELGFAHRFEQDSSLQLNLYSTSVQNQLYSASVPVTSFGGASLFDPTLLAQYATKLSFCPGVNPGTPSSVLPFLSFQVPANLGQGSFQGVEISGRQRLTTHLALDYTYDIQKAALNGVPLDVLHSAWSIVPGGQIPLIPMHKGQLGLDYTSGGWEGRLDGFYVGNNNPQERPAYSYFNAFVAKELRKGYRLNLAVQNLFNQNTEHGYGYIGHGQFIPENQFGTDKTSIDQVVSGNLGLTNELFGLPSTTVQLTLSVQI